MEVVFLGAAALVSWLGVRAITHWAKQKLLDVPNDRSSHSTPTPRGGGAAIALVVVAGWSIALVVSGGTTAVWLIATSTVIACISWLDDLHTLKSRTRFMVHAAAVGIMAAMVGYVDTFAFPAAGTFFVGLVGVPLTLVWGIGLTNAYNFMDGIDGIAALQALAASVGWACLGWLAGHDLLLWSGIATAGATLGFLPHNWSPARIFMGDVGSAFLGFVFAALLLVAIGDDSGAVDTERVPIVAVAFVWPFVFDAMLTFLRRLKNGEDVFTAHRSHLYQRMVISGRSHAFVSSIYGILAAIAVAAALFWYTSMPWSEGALLVVLLVESIGLVVVTTEWEKRSSIMQ